MFNPSRDQARQLFFDAWAKYQAAQPLTDLEKMALEVILLHPEYQRLLDDPQANLDRDWRPEGGEVNPFLHLSLHLAVEEQISIDQPPGMRAQVERLARKLDDPHEARHQVLECLAETIWQAQRGGGMPDGAAYLECVKRR